MNRLLDDSDSDNEEDEDGEGDGDDDEFYDIEYGFEEDDKLLDEYVDLDAELTHQG